MRLGQRTSCPGAFWSGSGTSGSFLQSVRVCGAHLVRTAEAALCTRHLTPFPGQPWVEVVSLPSQMRLREAPGDIAHGHLGHREKPMSNTDVGN